MGLTFLLAIGVGVWIGRRQGVHTSSTERSHRSDSSPVRVETLRVMSTETPQYLEAAGTLKASLTSDIAPKIMSKVTSVLVKEGDPVQAGQVLVRLEAADLAAQVRQALAGVASARAALAQSQTGAVIQKTQSSTRVEQARAALRQAEQQLSLVSEGSRRQQKQQADEGVRQAEAGKAQAEEAVQQARAALSSAQAQLSLVREGARSQQKMQADAALRQADASLRTAQATYDRFKPLADDGVISKQRFDEIALQLEIAKGQAETARQQASLVREGARTQEIQQSEDSVKQAEAAVRMAEQKAREAEAVKNSAKALRDMTYEGPRSQEIRQTEEELRQAKEALRMAQAATGENRMKGENVNMLRAQVAQAEASLSVARVQLRYATITAPFSGVVVKRNVDPGAMATPGTPLLTIVDSSGFRLEAIVPESKIDEVRLGSDAPVTLDALGRTLAGHIAQVVPNADPSSRTFVVKVGLPKVSGLSAGLFGRAKIGVGTSKNIVIPKSAVWRKESLVGVFVVDEGIARKRLVTVGKPYGDKVEVPSGLKEGDVIVASGVDELNDGARVQTGGEWK